LVKTTFTFFDAIFNGGITVLGGMYQYLNALDDEVFRNQDNTTLEHL